MLREGSPGGDRASTWGYKALTWGDGPLQEVKGISWGYKTLTWGLGVTSGGDRSLFLAPLFPSTCEIRMEFSSIVPRCLRKMSYHEVSWPLFHWRKAHILLLTGLCPTRERPTVSPASPWAQPFSGPSWLVPGIAQDGNGGANKGCGHSLTPRIAPIHRPCARKCPASPFSGLAARPNISGSCF